MELAALRLKNFVLRAGSWIKAHWAIFAALVITAVALVFTKHKDDLIALLNAERSRAAKEHSDTVATLQLEIETEVRKRQEIERQYNDLMATIKQQHDVSVQQIAAEQQAEVRRIIAESYDNPAKLAESLNSLFGIQVIAVPSPSAPTDGSAAQTNGVIPPNPF